MIPIFRPSMNDEEIEAVANVLKSGWIGLGPITKKFEDKFAEYVGVKYAIGLNSCTAALHLAINSLGINSGEIITTPITFVSTAQAILYNGATPIFADIQEDTLNVDPSDIEEKISKNTKAIIPVHYGGHPCDMDEINKLASNHNLYVIEDCAHAAGAKYKGKKSGSLGDLGCFSFHVVKNLATGDGGMITTNDKDLYEKLIKLRWSGINASTYQRNMEGYSWYYDVEYLGFKAHMNDITASIGLVQLKKLDRMNTRRREIFETYNREFADVDWIKTPIEKAYVKSAFHNYVIKVDLEDRNKLISYLAENSISAGVHYMPLHFHSFFKKRNITADTPIAEKIWSKIVTLPLYPDLTSEDLNKVIKTVKDFKENI